MKDKLNRNPEYRLSIPDEPTWKDFNDSCKKLQHQRSEIDRLEKRLHELRWEAHRRTVQVQEIAEEVKVPSDELVKIGRISGVPYVATVWADTWEAKDDEDRVTIKRLH
jgi:vacuolar-type H+-ATPase subunit I/STV1